MTESDTVACLCIITLQWWRTLYSDAADSLAWSSAQCTQRRL